VAITKRGAYRRQEECSREGSRDRSFFATVSGIGLAVPRLSVGRVSIEGEMLDSTSGDRQIAFVTGKGGRKWFSGVSGFKKWVDIEAAFRTWAKNFRERLDEEHAS
jgi:hypothetical protein